MADESNVIVIGGGVIGMTIAWRLRQAGVGVTLLERGECGRQASWAAIGVLAPGNPNIKHALAQLHLESLDLHPDFCAELRQATCIDPQYRRCERLTLIDEDQRYRMGLSEVRAAADRRMPDGAPGLEMLTPEQAVELEPAIRAPRYGALLCRVSASVRNPRLLKALRTACAASGVDVREHQPVAGLVWEGERVRGVRTHDGEHSADTVVLAAGAWSSGLDPRVDEVMPVHPVRGQAVLLEMPEPPFARIVRRKRVYVVRRDDGKILVGATEEPEAGFEIRNTAAGVRELVESAMDFIPALADASVAGMWSGLRPGTRDGRPYIGFVPGADRLMAACGHFKTGLVFAPITARIVTELVTTGDCPYDLARAAPGRPERPRRTRRS
jgi:glycine oxidase